MFPGDGPVDPPTMSDGEYILWLEAERKRLQVELPDTRNAIRLILGRRDDIPWSEVSRRDVDSYVVGIRELKKAVEAAREE